MTIHELYNQIYPTKEIKNSEELINFYNDPNCNLTEQMFINLYESQIHIINEALINKDNEVYYKAMHIHIDYALSIGIIKEYKESIPILNRAIDLMEAYPGFKNKDLFDNFNYTELIYFRGRANAGLFNIKKARKDLNKLRRRCPTYHDDCGNIIHQFPGEMYMFPVRPLLFASSLMFLIALLVALKFSVPNFKVLVEMFSVQLVGMLLSLLLVICAKIKIALKKREQKNNLIVNKTR